LKLERSAGLLLHPTSLPGRFGIGEISELAYRWVDTLVSARQTVWQVLPLGPTGYGDSPYQTFSAFAGNPLLIDLARLAHEGYVAHDALKEAPVFPEERVDFGPVITWKKPLLLGAYQQFATQADAASLTAEVAAFNSFCAEHDTIWLHDYAFFMALKDHFHGEAWGTWPRELRRREPAVLAAWGERLAPAMMAHKFVQYQFFKQWGELKRYANEHGILIFGDIPIYVSYDSADVWARQELFSLDEDGRPTVVAGVPPDYFSPTGQLWGNPLYRWDVMAAQGYQWWIERVRMMLHQVDMVRFDHFRGFEAYWEVPAGEETAVNGRWVKGPDAALFEAFLGALGDPSAGPSSSSGGTSGRGVPIIAEDLGVITPEVEALRDGFGFPGMKILQFAFDDDATNPYLPHNYERNCVVYTGSHDNDTTRGWFASAPEPVQAFCTNYLGYTSDDIAWALMRLAASSVAALAIFPVQDVLSLGSEARMNMPSQASGNWSWRLRANEFSENHVARLAELAETYGRAGISTDDHHLGGDLM
jgi:4-alpha-glucanotransferase